MREKLFCFFIHQFSGPGHTFWRATTWSLTPAIVSPTSLTTLEIDDSLMLVSFINRPAHISSRFAPREDLGHVEIPTRLFDLCCKLRNSEGLPVLIEASSSLIFVLAPVIPTDMLNTVIHITICKNHSPKRPPWTSKMCIWGRSATCDHTSAKSQEKCLKNAKI